MPGNSAQTSHVSTPKISNSLLLVNCVLFASLLAVPMFPGAVRYFSNAYLCLGIILLIAFLNYRLYKALGGFLSGSGLIFEAGAWKIKAKILAWAVLVPAVMLLGVGPITNPAAYEVDKFIRVFGAGVVNDYSVSKKVHYFYFTLIIYGLLVYNFYLNLLLSLRNNLHNKIRRLGDFADTLLFVGWSFLLVCAYRQFSSHYSYDLTLYLFKSFMVFMIPAFYLWETGKLKVQDVRVMLSLALFSLVLSAGIAYCFDTRNFGRFSDILAIVLLSSVLLFSVNKVFGILDGHVLYSKIVVISLIGAVSLVLCSILFEMLNVLALKSGRFTDAEKILLMVFYSACWLSLGWFCCVRKPVSSGAAGWALLAFVMGIALIQAQPSLIIGSDLNIYEGANYAVPVSDFFNFGKIPLFENFPGHGLHLVVSSIAYGFLSSDYRGAIFAPWGSWMFSAACILVLYCFIKRISNGLIAAFSVIVFPYLLRISYSYALGLLVFLPFIQYAVTGKRKYLILTAVSAVLIVAYKLDVGFASLAAVVCSSFCISMFYRNKIIFRVLLYLMMAAAAVFVLFLADCLVKDINPVFRIRQYLAIASSNENWGYATLGDTEKNSYSFFYFAVPVIAVACFIVALACRAKFTMAGLALMLCLLFAYYANLPRLLVRHSLAEYRQYSLWLWTMPIALSFLISRMFSSRSLYILCQTAIVLTVWVVFQPTTFYENSPLQNTVSRAERLSAEISPDNRKKDISFVYSRGSRVTFNEAKSQFIQHENEIRTVAGLLLSPDETYLDFTNLSAAYPWTGRENPAYVVQPPSMLSGEKSQRFFIKEIEERLETVPVIIMPANLKWYLMMMIDGVCNNIRHYLVAEWIYNNYRPLFKWNEFASVWVQNSRYEEFYAKLPKAAEFVGVSEAVQNFRCHDCEAEMTESGLRIHPTGRDPYLLGFEQLLGADISKQFTNLTLSLANDNNDRYQIFFTSDKVKKYEEQHSVRPHGMSPRIKFFDFGKFQDAGHINTLRLDVPETGDTVIKSVSAGTMPLQISLIDWGYDNFISLPMGASPEAKFISNAHDYNVGFLPYAWGQFDSENAASNSDLATVSENGGLYTWSYSGHEHKPAYLRLDLSASAEFLKKNSSPSLLLGSMENGRFTPLCRFRFRLKEGRKVYLFRISSDYYWSRGKLNALSLDPNLRESGLSVRILEGD